MILNNQQIELIEYEIQSKGIQLNELLESMIDHVCCQIENSNHADFDKALSEALSDFSTNEMTEIQDDMKSYLAFRKFKKSKQFMYSFAFISAFLIISGVLFKAMHWPSAGICLVLGIFFLNFGFLPLFFYGRYKESLKV
jgi:hypothetical protein